MLPTETPPRETTVDVDAGVIQDARARQRRRTWIAAVAIAATAAPVAIGLLASRGADRPVVARRTVPRASGSAVKGGAGITYTVGVTPPLKAGVVGWCLAFTEHDPPVDGGGGSGGSGCGGTRLGAPFVASQIGGFGTQSESFVNYVYVTTAQVAAVRISPKLTIHTRSDPRLPDGDRIAVGVAPGNNAVKQAPVALTRAGAVIPAHPLPTVPSEPALFWHKAAPPAACELDTAKIPGARPTFGEVVPRLRAFPQVAPGTLLSCASMSFTIHRETINAAILLNAQHPGTPPGSLPGTASVARQPETVNEPASRTGINLALTGRRIGSAWLMIETSGTLANRLTILNNLTTCVQTSGRLCPSP